MVSTAVDASAVARVVGIKTEFKDLSGGAVQFLPQRVMLVGQGNTAATYTLEKTQVTSALAAANKYGFGSPIHLACLQLLPTNGDGVGTIPVTVYPLEDNGSGVVAAGDITPSGTATANGTFVLSINNITTSFVVLIGDVVADITAKIAVAVAANINLPMTAVDGTTVVDLTSKWAGTSANALDIAISGPDDTGISYVITQPFGGLLNPTVDAALALKGDVWESMLLNCLELSDTVALDTIQTFGEGLWDPLVSKPLVSFCGNTAAGVAAVIAVPDARKTDRVNSVLVSPGSLDLPLVVAARQLARIVKLANNNPPHDYGSQKATGLVPGTDGEQWLYADRDQAVKGGSSTIEVKDGVVNVSDVVTFYHPTGDPTPAYRYVVDIVKLQQVLFNTALIFKSEDWDGAPLIPDDQPTANPDAKKPKTAIAEIASMIDSLGLNAIISDPKTAKTTIVAQISVTNPKRLDTAFTLQLSGNANIISIDFNFGFFFGAAVVVG